MCFSGMYAYGVCLCVPGGSHWSSRPWGRGARAILKTILLEAINVLQTAGQFSKCGTVLRSAEIKDNDMNQVTLF